MKKARSKVRACGFSGAGRAYASAAGYVSAAGGLRSGAGNRLRADCAPGRGSVVAAGWIALRVGDRVRLRGRSFTGGELHPSVAGPAAAASFQRRDRWPLSGALFRGVFREPHFGTFSGDLFRGTLPGHSSGTFSGGLISGPLSGNLLPGHSPGAGGYR